MIHQHEYLAANPKDSFLGFNGERIDPVLGSYHMGNGYRLYNPALRRFTTPDDMSPFSTGGINPYVYCAGDPINNTDPTGHFRVFGFLENIGLIALGSIDEPEVDFKGIREVEYAFSREADHIGVSLTRGDSEYFSRGRAFSAICDNENTRISGSDASHDMTPIYMKWSTLALDGQPSREMSYISDSENFDHSIQGRNIESIDKNYCNSFFGNKYTRKKWTFNINERDAKSPYYASDIVKYQYRVVSRKFSFEGIMPELIERHNVTNKTTLEKVRGINAKNLLNVFMQETPNGRSTQRILQEFNLLATGIERFGNDFIINVMPKSHTE